MKSTDDRMKFINNNIVSPALKAMNVNIATKMAGDIEHDANVRSFIKLGGTSTYNSGHKEIKFNGTVLK